MSDARVAVRELSVRYPGDPADALREVSFDVRAGELVGLVGETAAGRTTLLRTLAGIVPGLVRATVTGSIRIVSADPVSTPVASLADRVAFVSDDPETQLSQRSVADEVAFGLENLGVPLAEMRMRVPEALARVGLDGLEERDPLTLSGGEQQRLVVACAIAMRPQVLLMDDPTANLDPRAARAVFTIARELAQRDGIAVLVASHDLDLLREHAHRVLGFEAGRLVIDGSPDAALVAVAARPPGRVPRVAGHLVTRAAVAQPGDAPGVAFDAVSYTYPGATSPAVDDITFQLAAGEVLAIAGASGSGKSTVARLAMGLLRPAWGRVRASGLDTRTSRPQQLARSVGLVFQNPNHQLLAASVREELALGPRNLGLPSGEVEERVRESAVRLDLTSILDVHPYRLGIGQRKRVAIASVLAMRPSTLVLDEPTTGQGRREVDGMAELVRSAAGEGTAVIVITHDARFAGEVADRFLVLDGGRVQPAGRP